MTASPVRPVAAIIEDNTVEFFLGLGRANGCEVYDGPDVKYVFAGGGFNRVMRDRFPTGSARDVVGRTVAQLDDLGIDALWFVTPASMPGLPAVLARHGFVRHGGWNSMAIELSAFASRTAAPAGLEIREVACREEAEDWAGTVVAGFGLDDDLHRGYGEHLIARSKACGAPRHYYLGLLDGRPAATALFFEGTEAAGIYWVCTLPAARGRGIATAMTGHALREAKATGYRYATLNASEAGYPVYQKMGFADCYATAIYRRPASR